MPLSSSNLSMIGPTSSSLRPEYTTSEPSSDAEPASDAEPPCESDPSLDSSCPHPVPARATTTKSARMTRDLFQDRAKPLLSNATPELAGECSSWSSLRGGSLMTIICNRHEATFPYAGGRVKGRSAPL